MQIIFMYNGGFVQKPIALHCVRRHVEKRADVSEYANLSSSTDKIRDRL